MESRSCDILRLVIVVLLQRRTHGHPRCGNCNENSWTFNRLHHHLMQKLHTMLLLNSAGNQPRLMKHVLHHHLRQDELMRGAPCIECRDQQINSFTRKQLREASSSCEEMPTPDCRNQKNTRKGIVLEGIFGLFQTIG